MLDRRDGREVERIARVGLIGADAALAEHDVGVALVHDVLRRVEPLVDRRREAALQEHRLARLADRLEQAEILHVARADLQHVGVCRHAVDRLDRRDLRHDLEPRALARLREELQPLLLETLEGIRARARLVRATAQELRARLFHDVRRLEELLARLDGAGAGHHDRRAVADLHARDIDDARARMELAARELVALGDRDRLLHAIHRLERHIAELPLVADDADDALGRAVHDLCLEARVLDGADDRLDVLCRCFGIHDDNHSHTSFYFIK